MTFVAAKLNEINKAKVKVQVKLRDLSLENVDLDNYKDKLKEIDCLFDKYPDLVYNLIDNPPEGLDGQKAVRPYNTLLHIVVQNEVAVMEKVAIL